MTMNEESLTSTTAPGKIFHSRAEIAEHYRSDWHRYNLKRKEAGLPVLSESDFQIRLQAAQAIQLEKLSQQNKNNNKNQKKNTTSSSSAAAASNNHLKKNKPQKSRNPYPNVREKIVSSNNNNDDDDAPTTTAVSTTLETGIETTLEDDDDDGDEKVPSDSEDVVEDEMQVEIDPLQCLFDRHVSDSVESNVTYMQSKYGFFVPDKEYLVDLEGLIGYCHEKIHIGKTCLYCQRAFTTPAACRNHMVAVTHTKLRYEPNIDLDEFDVFYDFTKADQEFFNNYHQPSSTKNNSKPEEIIDDDDNMDDDGDDDEWEDMSEDSNEDNIDNKEDEDDNDDLWEGYKQHIDQLRMGSLFELTALGELVFPDGRVIGHRNLKRYYKQHIPTRETSEAVVAARQAAGERLYGGRVYQLGYGTNAFSTATAESDYNKKAMVLSKAGIAPGTVTGRAGKGILVPTSGGGGYSQLSIYRFRAAVHRQRRGEIQGKKIYERTKLNMNRMDKKHNRLMNGVSVAHAAR
jgi:pre-60S factor REI1